jgi:hypothetical protein
MGDVTKRTPRKRRAQKIVSNVIDARDRFALKRAIETDEDLEGAIRRRVIDDVCAKLEAMEQKLRKGATELS